MGKTLKVVGIVWASIGAYMTLHAIASAGAIGDVAGAVTLFAVLLFVLPGLALAARGAKLRRNELRDELRNAERSSAPERRERPCPYCAEPILEAARVCKHCGRDLPTRELETRG